MTEEIARKRKREAVTEISSATVSIWGGVKRTSPMEGCHEDDLAFTEACLNSLNLHLELIVREKKN